MKRIHLFSAIFLMFTAISVTSCDVEPIDPAIDLSNPGPGGGDGSDDGSDDGGTPGGGTSSGDYWPAAVNNVWRFMRSGSEFDMKMVSTNTIGGNTYYTFNEQESLEDGGLFGAGTQRFRKSGASYYIRTEDIVVQGMGPIPGLTISGSEIIILKDDLPVGGTWNHNYTQTTTYTNPAFPPVTMAMALTNEILEKNSTVTVGTTTYSNVIKTKMTQTATIPGLPPTTMVTLLWFAKDVGPVLTETSGADENYTSELQSFTLN